MDKSKLTAVELRKHVKYDPETGVFTRLVNSSRSHIGAATGSKHKRGYLIVGVLHKRYWAHVLAWLYMTGEWPAKTIDHENRDRADNRWKNLREVTTQEQSWNKGVSRGKTSSQYLGVYGRGGRWFARITANGHNYHLGSFGDEEAAYAAYLGAKSIYHVVGAMN